MCELLNKKLSSFLLFSFLLSFVAVTMGNKVSFKDACESTLGREAKYFVGGAGTLNPPRYWYFFLRIVMIRTVFPPSFLIWF